eukprot:3754140-Prymnesium_polylepis.1
MSGHQGDPAMSGPSAGHDRATWAQHGARGQPMRGRGMSDIGCFRWAPFDASLFRGGRDSRTLTATWPEDCTRTVLEACGHRFGSRASSCLLGKA